MTDKDLIWWHEFREGKKTYLNNDEYLMICEIYARAFNVPLVYFCKGCGNKFQSYINEINEVYQIIIQWK